MNNDTPLILIVEDDKRLMEINSQALETEGYGIKCAFTLKEARFLLEDQDPDVILLDVKMPDGSGFDFCREIRERSSAAIIFLTSVTETESELEGLVAGGDDYLRKPYGIKLLRARVKRSLKKARKTPQFITRGPFSLNIVSSQAFADNEDLLLTQKEFAVLLLLAQSEGKIYSAEEIWENVWGYSELHDKNALQMTISRLRTKIEETGYTITAYRMQGYAFEKS